VPNDLIHRSADQRRAASSAGTTLTLPALRAGPLPLPRCGRGAGGAAPL